MSNDDCRGKRVTIMGLGLFGGGVGSARYFAQRGAQVTVTDLKPPEDLIESIRRLNGYDISYRLRRHRRSDFVNADIVIPSPAVPVESPLLRLAREHGARLDTEMNIFVENCPAQIIGVTGTNGKTTTSSMIDHIITTSGRRSRLGGNIGCSLLAELPSIETDDNVVLEMSSFQLEWLPQTGRSPHISVITNIAPDHFDRHKTMDRYADAKSAILRNQQADDFAVLNADCPMLARWRSVAPSSVVLFGMTAGPEPGVYCENGEIVSRLDDSKKPICPVDAVSVPGRHNVENALAATAVCVILGIEPAAIEAGLRSFEAVEHRLELIIETGGVQYYNDSKATTPDSTIVAINAFDGPVVLIAGGSGKGLSFEKMAERLVDRGRGLVVIGRTGPEIARAVEQASDGNFPTACCTTLGEAVAAAASMAVSGDVVLFSPGDASYDMFQNYEERGAAFKKEVQTLSLCGKTASASNAAAEKRQGS